MPTANGMQAREMPLDIKSVTPKLATKQGSLLLNTET